MKLGCAIVLVAGARVIAKDTRIQLMVSQCRICSKLSGTKARFFFNYFSFPCHCFSISSL
jgi:hypothetical protein